jgi:ribosome-interacting GTPase 1
MQEQNNINDLRDVLFDTLRQLKDKDKPMEIERAKAISDIAQTIINSAKVEIDHARVTGETSTTKFIPQEPKPVNNGYVHRIGQRHNQ